MSEFFLGAFETDWQRRRAALLHELATGQEGGLDWDWRRRGGVARLPEMGGRLRRGGGRRLAGGTTVRSMRDRYTALARGSQPAVVKLASYGGAARVGAMVSYTAREGALAVENERGESIQGKDALTQLRGEWEHLFDNRADSRDVAVFNVALTRTSFDGRNIDAEVSALLKAGFGDRRFVFAIDEREGDEVAIRGVVVLRDRSGERLTGDSKAADIVRQRFDESELGSGIEAHFRFHGYGNGVRFATARVRDLVERFNGGVRDETGHLLATSEDAGDLVQKSWRHEMHSRKGRDVVHLIVSARAGTDPQAFQKAVRDFLGVQFGGHRYVFAVHDPSQDPKEMSAGGKRPHIHAHAIITMRSETGERIHTSPKVFREWRSRMAEQARDHGIDMEFTDRRDQSSAPAYVHGQVRPVTYEGRTEHKGTSQAAQVRYEAKRENVETIADTARSRSYVASAEATWRSIAADAGESAIARYAELQVKRVQNAIQNMEKDAEIGRIPTVFTTNMIVKRVLADNEEVAMQNMTRPEFEAYEKRVEAALESVQRSIDETGRASFEEFAAAAREVVDIRREQLELSERQPGVNPLETAHEDRAASARDVDAASDQVGEAGRYGIKPDHAAVEPDEAARYGRDDAAVAHAVLSRMSKASRDLQSARDDGRETSLFERRQAEAVWVAGELGFLGNKMLQAEAGHVLELRDAIENSEAQRAIGEIGAARVALDIAKDRNLDTDRAENELDKALWRAADLAQKGNDHIRAHAQQDAELNAAIIDADREAATFALDEIVHHQDNIRLVQDPGFAARRGYTVHDEHPSEHIDIDHEYQSLANALEKAAQLGLEGNRFVLDAAQANGALKETIERLQQENVEQQQTLDKAQEALRNIDQARDALAAAEAGQRPDTEVDDLRTTLERSLWRAADLAYDESNPHVLDAAANDPDLAVRITHLGELDTSHYAGEHGLPMPDVAKGDAALLEAYEHGFRKYESDIAIADSEIPYFGRTEDDSDRDWEEFKLLERALRREQDNLSQLRKEGDRHLDGDRGHATAPSVSSTRPADMLDEAIARHGASAVRQGNDILAELDSASAVVARVGTVYSRDYFSIESSKEQRETIHAEYLGAMRNHENALGRYAREALDGNTYLYEVSKDQEHLQQAIKDEVHNREFQRYVDLRDPDRGDAVARHGEEAVRIGNDLFAQIDAAQKALRSLQDDPRRDDGWKDSPDTGQRDADRDASEARLIEAQSKHADLLREAASAALDGNTYIREMGNIKHDLNNQIHLEARRRTEAELGRDQDANKASSPIRSSDRPTKVHDEHGSDPKPEHVSRLRQIEQDIKARHERDRDDREQ